MHAFFIFLNLIITLHFVLVNVNHDEYKQKPYKQFTNLEKYDISPYSLDYGKYKVKLYASMSFKLKNTVHVAINYAAVSTVAVSYTHLDVYKRQRYS